MKRIKFKHWNCEIVLTKYKNNGRTCIQLVNNGELVLVATTNLEDIGLSVQEVIIKNYSENKGIYEVLLENGIIGPVKRFVENGFVKFYICDLKI
jgi:hypothetical protein